MSRFESAGGAYWDARYRAEPFPFGSSATRSAERAIAIFRTAGARRVVVAGCGSGRHLLALARAGFDASGFDVSPVAVDVAREALEREGLRADLEVRDLLAGVPPRDPFDALFSYSVLQLFDAAERPLAARALLALVRPGGVAVIAAFSTADAKLGDGIEQEPRTFRNARGRTAHFFERDEIAALFAPHAQEVEVEPIDEPDGETVHRLLLVTVRL